MKATFSSLFFFFIFLNTTHASDTPLIGLHERRQHVSHLGTIEYMAFSQRDSRLVYSAKCEAILITDYSPSAEMWVNGGPVFTERAYFELQVLDHCKEEIFNSPTSADGPRPEPGNSVPFTLTVDIARLRGHDNNYQDNFDVFINTAIIAKENYVKEIKTSKTNLPVTSALIFRKNKKLGLLYREFSTENADGFPVRIEVKGSFF